MQVVIPLKNKVLQVSAEGITVVEKALGEVLNFLEEIFLENCEFKKMGGLECFVGRSGKIEQ